MSFILHDSRHAQTVLPSQEIPNFKILLARRKHGEEVSGQISAPAVRWVLICCQNPQLSLLLCLTRLPPSSCQPFISPCLLLHTTPLPTPTPYTGKVQNCPWALLVPAPLKWLVTQALSGPRVWKLLIEDCLQPEWQTQGHCSVVVAVCCSCLCGGLCECPVESRQWAMVITCHSSQRFLSLCPDHRLQKQANSLCVIFVMIHPSVHMDATLSFLRAHKHWPHALVYPLHSRIQMHGCSLVLAAEHHKHQVPFPPSEFWFSAPHRFI